MKQVKRAAKKEREILDTQELFFFREGLEKKLLRAKDANEYLAAKKKGQALADFMKDRTPPKTYAYLQKFSEQRTEEDRSGTIVGANTGGSNTLSLPPDVQSRLPKTNEAKTKTEAPSIEQQINEMLQGDRYKIHRTIGKGGMGAVYEATDNRLGCRVALKNMLNEDKSNVERFVREARITAGLRHPNIITVTDIGQINGKMYYAMTFVESCKDLSHVFKELQENKTAYAQKDLLRLCHSICNAMEFAHKHEVIHRDLKPANVMVDQSGQLYVMDWGLAKKKGQKDEIMEESIAPDPEDTSPTLSRMSLTENGVTLGSPMYMPGEQVEGPEFVDERSDIYCVGAILYELMTLDQFRDITKGVHGVLKTALDNTFENPRRVNKELDPQLESIILKALAKEKADRYRTFQEFGDDIKKYIDGEKVLAHKYSILEKAGRFIQKHTTLVATGALAALVAIAGSIGYTGLASRARNAERETQKQTIKAQKKDLEAANAKAELAQTLQKQLDKARKQNAASENIWRGETALRGGKLEDAINYFTKAIEDDKDSIEAYFLRGKARYLNLNGEEAVADFETANQKSLKAAKEPDFRALYSKVMTYIDIHDDEKKAIEACKKIQLGDKKETYSLLIKSLLALGSKEYKKSMELAEEALAINDSNAEVLSFLSHALAKSTHLWVESGPISEEENQRALEYILQARESEPKNIRYLIQELRLQSTIMRNDERSLQLADKIIKMNPRIHFCYIFRAGVYLRQNKSEAVIQQINLAEQIQKLEYQGLALRGMAKCNMRKYDEALNDLNESIKQGKMPEAFMYRGMALGEKGNPTAAIQDCNTSIQLIKDQGIPSHLRPQYGQAHLFKGIYEEKAGKPQDALKTLAESVEYGEPRGWFYSARVYAHLGKNDEAEKHMRKFIETGCQEGKEQALAWLDSIKKK